MLLQKQVHRTTFQSPHILFQCVQKKRIHLQILQLSHTVTRDRLGQNHSHSLMCVVLPSYALSWYQRCLAPVSKVATAGAACHAFIYTSSRYLPSKSHLEVVPSIRILETPRERRVCGNRSQIKFRQNMHPRTSSKAGKSCLGNLPGSLKPQRV